MHDTESPQETQGPTERVPFSESLGRRIRHGEPIEQLGESTLSHALTALAAGNIDDARDLLESFRHETQVVHDLLADWTWGLLTWIQENVGEDAVGEALRTTVGAWATKRYEGYESLSFDERLALTLEGMRGHLSGQNRMGDVTVRDEGDRVVLEFDPCGSGGRRRRLVAEKTASSEADDPDYGHTDGPHDWTWQESGVCLYCAHCSFVNEILPIEQLGYPIRVTKYPQDANDPCRWTIYKDPAAIPEDAYSRVGKEKPGTPET